MIWVGRLFDPFLKLINMMSPFTLGEGVCFQLRHAHVTLVGYALGVDYA